VRVTVTDRGGGFPAGPLAPPGTLRSPNPAIPDLGREAAIDPFEQRFGGWGLPLVHRLADRVEILPNSPHGTTVRAEKRLRG
jgi:anti-sigma regulatory factor (Ser/Thr protein kinase)